MLYVSPFVVYLLKQRLPFKRTDQQTNNSKVGRLTGTQPAKPSGWKSPTGNHEVVSSSFCLLEWTSVNSKHHHATFT